MCQCTPELRTPFCGKPGCEMPKQIDQTFIPGGRQSWVNPEMFYFAEDAECAHMWLDTRQVPTHDCGVVSQFENITLLRAREKCALIRSLSSRVKRESNAQKKFGPNLADLKGRLPIERRLSFTPKSRFVKLHEGA